MLISGNIIFRATLLIAILIGPAIASNIARSDATPTTRSARFDPFAGQTSPPGPVRGAANRALVRLDPAAYAAAVPPVTIDRWRTFWLATTAILTLALATLVPRRAPACVVGVGLAWTIGLGIAIARRPTFDRVQLATGEAWLVAHGPTSLRLPPGWRPVAESSRHVRSLSLLQQIDGTVTLTLPAKGARVLIEPIDP
jgi:hypothetical protein